MNIPYFIVQYGKSTRLLVVKNQWVYTYDNDVGDGVRVVVSEEKGEMGEAGVNTMSLDTSSDA